MRLTMHSGMAAAGSRLPAVSLVIMERAVGEFREMPDLQLTAAQAARLWSRDPEVCSAVLCELVERGILVPTRRDAYSRVS